MVLAGCRTPVLAQGRIRVILVLLTIGLIRFGRIIHPHGPPDLVAPAGTAAAKPPRPISRDNLSSAATRFSVDGWVENRLSIPWPNNRLTINSYRRAEQRSAAPAGTRTRVRAFAHPGEQWPACNSPNNSIV